MPAVDVVANFQQKTDVTKYHREELLRDADPNLSLQLSPISETRNVIVPSMCLESSSFAHLFYPSAETFYCVECEDEYEEPDKLVKHYFNTHDVRFVPCTHCDIEIPWNEALLNNHTESCLTCPGPPKCTSCSLLAGT